MVWLANDFKQQRPTLPRQAYRALEDLRPVAPNPMSLASFERAAL